MLTQDRATVSTFPNTWKYISYFDEISNMPSRFSNSSRRLDRVTSWSRLFSSWANSCSAVVIGEEMVVEGAEGAKVALESAKVECFSDMR